MSACHVLRVGGFGCVCVCVELCDWSSEECSECTGARLAQTSRALGGMSLAVRGSPPAALKLDWSLR